MELEWVEPVAGGPGSSLVALGIEEPELQVGTVAAVVLDIEEPEWVLELEADTIAERHSGIVELACRGWLVAGPRWGPAGLEQALAWAVHRTRDIHRQRKRSRRPSFRGSFGDGQDQRSRQSQSESRASGSNSRRPFQSNQNVEQEERLELAEAPEELGIEAAVVELGIEPTEWVLELAGTVV